MCGVCALICRGLLFQSSAAISVICLYSCRLPSFSSSSLTPCYLPLFRSSSPTSPSSFPMFPSSSLPPLSSTLTSRRPPLSPSSPPHSPSSSAQAEDPVRVSAFLPFQLTHNLKGAAAPLDSRLRGSDGVWGLRGRGLTA